MPTNSNSPFDLLYLASKAKPYVAQLYQSFSKGNLGNDILDYLKWIAFVVSAVFGVLLVMVIVKMRRFFSEQWRQADFTPPPPDEGGPMVARWEEIKRHIDSNNEAQWKLAVIEADKLIDDILKRAGYEGESLGERLTLITHDQFSSLRDLWLAHRIRNYIVHDANFIMTRSDAVEAIAGFEKALKELQVLPS